MCIAREPGQTLKNKWENTNVERLKLVAEAFFLRENLLDSDICISTHQVLL